MSQTPASQPSHPSQAVSPGADPEQPGPAPQGELVDPEAAADAEFPPLLAEAAELDRPGGQGNG